MPVTILGIESSCDETSAAIAQDNKVLSNIIANQTVHQNYGGVVPELASRAHQKNIVPVVQQAIDNANIAKKDIDAIAYTRGPGLLGSLLVGGSFAKSLSIGLNIPLIEVHHMQAHILSHFIYDDNEKKSRFPFLGVNISGGHTQILRCDDYFDMEIIGETIDDSVGEAFDKCGKILGLDYPAGPLIDKLSKKGDIKKFSFTIPKVDKLNFSFSGLKTNFKRFVISENKKDPSFILNEINNLCASLQNTISEILYQKVEKAIQKTKLNDIVYGGGVSANSMIRDVFKSRMEHVNHYFPKLEYTTDNAAMIAIVGYLKYKNKKFGRLDASSDAKYKL